uniref:Anaphase-promoting complex subunit 4 WD40 domain-containing protein n=1 Tax=Vitrella brassicaformis TaxID=1169539 RepID=A0A7S1KC03_9ALVE|mmetsp:Transcript_4674/g.10816  ORF Transcript_4674/g.10816 Transcript_4674/m.10816 type:complete len:271 (+) Transcript_4674:1338-2150(+)
MPVRDIQFSPKKHGLRLATCSADGSVRIYEAQDLLSLGAWPMEDCFTSHKRSNCPRGCTALAWNFDSEDQILAVVGNDGILDVWGKSGRGWSRLAEQKASSAPLKDVAWAPSLCRPYDLLATCGDEPLVHIWQWKQQPQQDTSANAPAEAILPPSAESGVAGASDKWLLQILQKIEVSPGPIWRVCFNVTGTVLTAAADDGTVISWRCGDQEPPEWVPITTLIPGDDEKEPRPSFMSDRLLNGTGGGGGAAAAAAVSGGGAHGADAMVDH